MTRNSRMAAEEKVMAEKVRPIRSTRAGRGGG